MLSLSKSRLFPGEIVPPCGACLYGTHGINDRNPAEMMHEGDIEAAPSAPFVVGNATPP